MRKAFFAFQCLFLIISLLVVDLSNFQNVQGTHMASDFEVTNTPAPEVYLLREFYHNMNGDHWTVSNWNLDGDPCLDNW